MIERRKSICGPGGETAHHDPRKECRGNDRRNEHKNCKQGTWVLHQTDSIVPLGMITNVFPCQMLPFIYDGNYEWSRVPSSLL